MSLLRDQVVEWGPGGLDRVNEERADCLKSTNGQGGRTSFPIQFRVHRAFARERSFCAATVPG